MSTVDTIAEFEARVAGIPCVVGVLSYIPYRAAYTSGPPEHCCDAEGGESEWIILDRRGRPAPWLEKKLTDAEKRRIDNEVIEHMSRSICDDDY